MKVIVTRKMMDSDLKYIMRGIEAQIGKVVEFVLPKTYDENGLLPIVKDADVLMGPFVTEQLVREAKRLKLIQVPWTGMDTFDFSAMKDSGVPVCNTHSNADAVAEIGVAILLDLLKKVSYHDRKMRAGNWNRDQQPLTLLSRMVSGQKVCILGYGNIGSRVGKLISAFGATILAVDQQVANGRLPMHPEVAEAVTGEAWTQLAAQADVVICTLPLTDVTRNMINEDTIVCLKQGCILINLSRAAIMNETDVYQALKLGKLSGFGSDVWWCAPKRGESQSWPSSIREFVELDQVIFSPHRAGFIENSLPHLDGAIENLVRLYRGEPLKDIVDRTKQF